MVQVTHGNEIIVDDRGYDDDELMVAIDIVHVTKANWIRLFIRALTTVFKIDKNCMFDLNSARTRCDDESIENNGFRQIKKKTFVNYNAIKVNNKITINFAQHYQTNAIENGITNELKIIFST